MKLKAAVLDLDYSEIQKRIVGFIKTYVVDSATEGIVLGLSGGIDSCTIAALSALAIGGDNVLGLLLPEQETYNPQDVNDAKLVSSKFNLKTQTCNITPVLERFYKTIPIFEKENRVCKGNIKARTRMIYIYYYANKLNRIVCGSSDKSEAMMGYFTKWGDVAADISPIMDLYKTQVRKLAQHLGIPLEIVNKKSTPALWPKQFAETELGIKYEKLDLVLYGFEHFFSTEEIARQLKLEQEQVEEVKRRWLYTEHKRRMPPTTKIQFRTIGSDVGLPQSFH